MLNKVLVADGFDCISLSIKQIKGINATFAINEAKNGDNAFLKIKKAIYDKDPYHLLICDLNFKTEQRNAKLNSGEKLISAIKKIQPDIKIIVFSDEVKSFRIHSLFKDHNINAFVYKGRNSVLELEKSMEAVFAKQIKNTNLEAEALSHQSLVEIRLYDITLLKLISNGTTLDEISKHFQKTGLKPFSESSIEKGINKLRIHFNAKNKVHLIAIAKDLGLI